MLWNLLYISLRGEKYQIKRTIAAIHCQADGRGGLCTDHAYIYVRATYVSTCSTHYIIYQSTKMYAHIYLVHPGIDDIHIRCVQTIQLIMFETDAETSKWGRINAKPAVHHFLILVSTFHARSSRVVAWHLFDLRGFVLPPCSHRAPLAIPHSRLALPMSVYEVLCTDTWKKVIVFFSDLSDTSSRLALI